MVLLAVVASSAIAAAVLTPIVARLAIRIGVVVTPRADRWHRAATPLLGGLAMGLPVLVIFAAIAPRSSQTLVIIAAGTAALALGMLDDLRHLAPSTKLVGQVAVASLLAFGGIQVEMVTIAPVAFLLTIFWVVAMMNAINLMDNMDGLAGGITMIAALALTITAFPEAAPAALLAAATSGAALGFLIHNFPPARIFMGDTGSQFLGFALATAALLHTASGATSLGLAVLGPLAVLALPIFDTALVLVSRGRAGIPVSRGGTDHVSHRLAALGLTDRGTALMLYAIATILAVVGILADATSTLVLPLFGLAIAGLALFGVFLHEVDVYGWQANGAVNGGSGQRILKGFWTYGRFGTEIGIDAVLLTLAYYVAYLIRFEGIPQEGWTGLFAGSVPLIVGSQLVAMVVFGVYRTLWRYLGISDAILIARSLGLGTAVAALLIIFLGPTGYSRAVFILDALIAIAFLAGSRAFLLWLRQWFSARPRSGQRRVLIVGANDRGVSAARLFASTADGASYRPIGFLDDDPGKRYRQIAGIPVLGRTDQLRAVIERHRVDLVVVAGDPGQTSDIGLECEAAGVEFREFHVRV